MNNKQLSVANYHIPGCSKDIFCSRCWDFQQRPRKIISLNCLLTMMLFRQACVGLPEKHHRMHSSTSQMPFGFTLKLDWIPRWGGRSREFSTATHEVRGPEDATPGVQGGDSRMQGWPAIAEEVRAASSTLYTIWLLHKSLQDECG